MSQDDDHYLKRELYELIRKNPAIFDFLQAGSLDGVWYWDLESIDNEWMSPRFWELMGYDPAEKKHLASEWQDLIHQDDLKLTLENFKLHCENPDHPYDQLVRYRHKDGSTVWVRCRGLAIRDDTGKPIRLLGAHNDFTAFKTTEQELISRNKELRELAYYDHLTSVYNRHFFQLQFELQTRIALRHKSPLSILIIDVDHFKKINDQFGHLIGDEVLKAVASIVHEAARDSDILARYGGDEFVLLLSNTDEAGSITAAERMRGAIERNPMGNYSVTASVGIATLSFQSASEEKVSDLCAALFAYADKALYFAKGNGRNQIYHFSAVNNET